MFKNEVIHLWSLDFLQRYQDSPPGSIYFQGMMLGQLYSHVGEHEIGPLPHSDLTRKPAQMHQRPNQNIKYDSKGMSAKRKAR